MGEVKLLFAPLKVCKFYRISYLWLLKIWRLKEQQQDGAVALLNIVLITYIKRK